MNRMQRAMEFLNYIKNPLTKDKISKLYRENHIVHERCLLYGDFIMSLTELIFETYIGDDVMTLDDRKNHFLWCWNRTRDSFKLEGINFNDTWDLEEYFIEFFMEAYYKETEKDVKIGLYKKISDFWYHIFDYRKVKTRSDIDNLVEVYKLFDKSLNKSKKLGF